MRIKLKSHKYNSHNVCISTVKIAIPHVEPRINKIHKLPFFAKTHKFLGCINNWLYGTKWTKTLCLPLSGFKGSLRGQSNCYHNGSNFSFTAPVCELVHVHSVHVELAPRIMRHRITLIHCATRFNECCRMV